MKGIIVADKKTKTVAPAAVDPKVAAKSAKMDASGLRERKRIEHKMYKRSVYARARAYNRVGLTKSRFRNIVKNARAANPDVHVTQSQAYGPLPW